MMTTKQGDNIMTNNQRVFNKLFNDKVSDINFWISNGYSFEDAYEIVMSESVAGPKIKEAIIKHFSK
tara:strand:- start:1309 stop:1509 length:201 start_codon:yes stop_codon:yes gene_type:complete